MTTDPLQVFVVEYSIKQDATHVRSLRKMITNNLNNLAIGLSSDYVPIGLFHTREQADLFVIHFRQGLDTEAQLAHGTRNWHRVRDIVAELLPKLLNNLDSESETNKDLPSSRPQQ
jgi:hypothetical protein